MEFFSHEINMDMCHCGTDQAVKHAGSMHLTCRHGHGNTKSILLHGFIWYEKINYATNRIIWSFNWYSVVVTTQVKGLMNKFWSCCNVRWISLSLSLWMVSWLVLAINSLICYQYYSIQYLSLLVKSSLESPNDFKHFLSFCLLEPLKLSGRDFLPS